MVITRSDRFTPDDVFGVAIEEDPPARPRRICTHHSPDGSVEYADPSFSPDARSIAYSQGPEGGSKGIYLWSIGDAAGDCPTRPRLLVAGGSEPDWGPANVRVSQRPRR